MKNKFIKNPRLLTLFRQHCLPFLFFAVLTIALTWPTIRFFTAQFVGHPSDDSRHNLWLLWHVKEAMLGHQPFYEAPLLYYPTGISMHLHGIGPLIGLFALPFWPLGAVAAHNGATMLAFALSGYAIYLLARGLGLSQPAAFFTGSLYSVTPMHLGGLFGHVEKIFTALLPLVLLVTHFGLDPKRSRWWAVGTAVVLLLTLLFNGLHFVEAALSIGFFVLIAFLRSDTADRRELWRRIGIMGLSSIILVGPLALATAAAATQPGTLVDMNLASKDYQPDLVEFFLPPTFGRVFGEGAKTFRELFELDDNIEKWIYLSWTGVALAGVALVRKRQRSWRWLLLTAGWAVLALGPTLQVLGQVTFTEHRVPVIMPYAFFTMLPGLDFLRTPGRLMLMGFVGFSIVAGTGLHYLVEKWPCWRWRIAAILTVLVFLESWPQPWPGQPLRPVPPFYQSLAAEPAIFGVFDLPVMPPNALWHVSYSSRYQLDQMTHKKGIATGYISRPYESHPLFPCLIPSLLPPQPDVQVNGVPTKCYANILHDLAYYNYRYVVWHKPQPNDHYAANPAEVEETSAYLLDLLSAGPPLLDDDMTTVYAVPPLTAANNLSPTMGLLHNWHLWEDEWRWAKSPASLFISTPRSQEVRLVITPVAIYDPGPGQPADAEGKLTVSLDGALIAEVLVHTGKNFSVPLFLQAGIHTVSLSLEAGNFRPSDTRGGGDDTRWLSFATRSINLEIVE